MKYFGLKRKVLKLQKRQEKINLISIELFKLFLELIQSIEKEKSVNS